MLFSFQNGSSLYAGPVYIICSTRAVRSLFRPKLGWWTWVGLTCLILCDNDVCMYGCKCESVIKKRKGYLQNLLATENRIQTLVSMSAMQPLKIHPYVRTTKSRVSGPYCHPCPNPPPTAVCVFRRSLAGLRALQRMGGFPQLALLAAKKRGKGMKRWPRAVFFQSVTRNLDRFCKTGV